MTELVGRTLGRLGKRLSGRVSTPGDDGYAEAVAIWSKPVGRSPRAIVHCQTAEDVEFAILAARDCGLQLSVRGGGHDWAGRALCNGIVIDLSGMRAVTVASDGTAQIRGGARAMDVLAAAHPLGLAAVTGSVGAVGMAGLTLGGGYGPLIGRFGLALDNLVEAEVVLADGRVVVANDANEADLFWALRGGGGNFGVVTAMRCRLHALTSVRTGLLIYPFTEARAILDRCAEIAGSAPEELTFQVALVAGGPDGAPVVIIMPTWAGAPQEGETRFAPFLRLGTPIANTVAAMPYAAALTLYDPYLVDGQRELMETCWLPALDGGSIEAFVRAMETSVSPGCAIVTHEFRGAASRVPENATAFGLRRDHVLVEILATFGDRSDGLAEREHRQWARAVRESFNAKALPGGYPNLLAGDDDPDRIAHSYGGNADRLIEAKRRYDPDNVFRSAIPLPTTPAKAIVSKTKHSRPDVEGPTATVSR